jgi:hypothetical protein
MECVKFQNLAFRLYAPQNCSNLYPEKWLDKKKYQRKREQKRTWDILISNLKALTNQCLCHLLTEQFSKQVRTNKK